MLIVTSGDDDDDDDTRDGPVLDPSVGVRRPLRRGRHYLIPKRRITEGTGALPPWVGGQEEERQQDKTSIGMYELEYGVHVWGEKTTATLFPGEFPCDEMRRDEVETKRHDRYWTGTGQAKNDDSNRVR